MKEMFESKTIILFIVMFLGITIIGGNRTNKLEENTEKVEKQVITLNIK